MQSGSFAEKPSFRHVGNDDRRSETDEKAVLNDARNRCEGTGERLRVCDRPEGAIEDVVAAIGDESMAFSAAAELDVLWQAHSPGKVDDVPAGGFEAEEVDFDGQRKPPKPRDFFARIGDHHHPGRGGANDLLPKKRAPSPFDQTKLWVELVGAVDDKVQFRKLVQSGQWNCERLREVERSLRGGHA